MRFLFGCEAHDYRRFNSLKVVLFQDMEEKKYFLDMTGPCEIFFRLDTSFQLHQVGMLTISFSTMMSLACSDQSPLS